MHAYTHIIVDFPNKQNHKLEQVNKVYLYLFILKEDDHWATSPEKGKAFV